MSDAFALKQYVLRRRIFTFLGAKFDISDPEGNMIAFSKQKAFKLKEDIRLYTNESMSTELLTIQARNIIDFGAAYDVVDSKSGSKVGALRRKGWTSIVRDSWEFLNDQDVPIGKVEEDSMMLAMIRRYLSNLIPQSFHATVQNQHVVTFKQNWNPFVLKMTITINPGSEKLIEPRLVMAAAVLLAAIEGRQG